jgi:hypothetical protein
VSVDSPLLQETTVENSTGNSAEPTENRAILDVVYHDVEHDADSGAEQDADSILSVPPTPSTSSDSADPRLDPAVAHEMSRGPVV